VPTGITLSVIRASRFSFGYPLQKILSILLNPQQTIQISALYPVNPQSIGI